MIGDTNAYDTYVTSAAPIQNVATAENGFSINRSTFDPQKIILQGKLNSKPSNNEENAAVIAINVEKFSKKLDSIRTYHSTQKCAQSVRIALQTAGAVIAKHPIAAADWGATLTQIGYKQINPAFDHPQEGDIYIINRTHKHVYGHIAGFTGTEWVSDFKQRSYDVYKEDNVEYQYYRLGI